MENNSTKNSTVLVAGATGVLGMELCRQLAAVGKKVKGLVRTSSQKEKVNGLHELGVETVTGDMKDPQSLYQAFQNVGCDHFYCHIYHLAPARRFHRNG